MRFFLLLLLGLSFQGKAADSSYHPHDVSNEEEPIRYPDDEALAWLDVDLEEEDENSGYRRALAMLYENEQIYREGPLRLFMGENGHFGDEETQGMGSWVTTSLTYYVFSRDYVNNFPCLREITLNY